MYEFINPATYCFFYEQFQCKFVQDETKIFIIKNYAERDLISK